MGLQTSVFVSRVFQRVNDLPPTGELDEATLEVMRKPRCGMEDPFNKKHHRYRVMGEFGITKCDIITSSPSLCTWCMMMARMVVSLSTIHAAKVLSKCLVLVSSLTV